MSDDRVGVERTIFIAAPPEAVFEFLVDPSQMSQWIGRSHALDAQPGGLFQVEVSHRNVAIGKFVEVKPPRRVAFTWGWESDDTSLTALKPGTSLVEIDLEPRNGGTLLRLRHTKLPTGLEGKHGERWSHYLGQLGRAARSDKLPAVEDNKP